MRSGRWPRYGLSQIGTPGEYGFSYATFVANVTGAFALGLLVAACARRWPSAHYVRPALGTGMLGGYTTFSTYLVEAVLRIDHGRTAIALSYVVLSLAVGLAAAFAGLALGGGRRRP